MRKEYEVKVYGNADLKYDADYTEMMRMVSEMNKRKNTHFEFEHRSDGIKIAVWDRNLIWDEKKFYPFLDIISVYISAGNLECRGEDGDVWKYEFLTSTRKWAKVEEKDKPDVELVELRKYTDDDLLAELRRRGYRL